MGQYVEHGISPRIPHKYILKVIQQTFVIGTNLNQESLPFHLHPFDNRCLQH